MEQLSLLFDEAEVIETEGRVKEAHVVEVRAHERKKSGSVKDVVPEDIPVETVEHHLPEEERVCPQCGEEMQVIGKEVKETLVFKPAEAYLRRDIYYTYACRQCDKNDISTPVVKTPKIPCVIPGGYASAEAVAYIAVQKFVMCAPLYRQELDWNRKHIRISRQTMANWLIRCAKDWLTPIYDELHADLIKTFQSLSTKERKKQRSEQAKPVLNAMWAWSEARHAAPKSKPGEALTYLRNQWSELNNYLSDGRLEISNNRAERSIKPFVMSRKNFLFANTPKGAQSSAVIFSLIETAKENGLDPYRYLTWVLNEAPKREAQENWAKELVPQLAPASCRA